MNRDNFLLHCGSRFLDVLAVIIAALTALAAVLMLGFTIWTLAHTPMGNLSEGLLIIVAIVIAALIISWAIDRTGRWFH